MVASVIEAPVKPLWEQVFDIIQVLRGSGRLSWNPSREELQDPARFTPGCLQSMLHGYQRRLHGSGRNESA